MESDLLIIAAQTDELRDRLESLPGYNLSSVKDGAVSVMSQMQITALNEPSPNSIIYAFGVIKPALAAAAEE